MEQIGGIGHLKKEINENICYGCLSNDRKLSVLGEDSSLYLHLLERESSVDPSNIILCWECIVMLRKTRRFQERIQHVQDLMRHSLGQDLTCLSTLTQHTNFPDSDILLNYSETEGADKTSPPGENRVMIEIGEEYSNDDYGLDKDVEIKCENKYDSMIEVEENAVNDEKFGDKHLEGNCSGYYEVCIPVKQEYINASNIPDTQNESLKEKVTSRKCRPRKRKQGRPKTSNKTRQEQKREATRRYIKSHPEIMKKVRKRYSEMRPAAQLRAEKRYREKKREERRKALKHSYSLWPEETRGASESFKTFL